MDFNWYNFGNWSISDLTGALLPMGSVPSSAFILLLLILPACRSFEFYFFQSPFHFILRIAVMIRLGKLLTSDG